MSATACKNYSAFALLRDGRSIEIRALRPDDETQMLEALSRTSLQTLYRRFFGVKKGFSEGEKAFFLNANFTDHIALVATIRQGNDTVIVGGARYVVAAPGVAEVALMVVDEFQGNGIGSALMRHLIFLAKGASIKRLVADVLPDNTAMLNVFRKCGLAVATTKAKGVVHVGLEIQ